MKNEEAIVVKVPTMPMIDSDFFSSKKPIKSNPLTNNNLGRRVIQISSSQSSRIRIVIALCDDGTLWEYDNSGSWIKLPEIPQN